MSLPINLEKKAPKIFNLAKKAQINLEKVNLQKHRAKVALCLDISGSMSFLYSSGKIQEFAEKILALGCNFDDDGSIDIFLFGANAHQAGEMNLNNFANFITQIEKKYPLEGGTYYGKVMTLIRQFYFPKNKGKQVNQIRSFSLPVYVMFVTDGNTFDEKLTEQQLQLSSYEPIFWQFMAIGKSKKDITQGGFGGWLSRAFASDFSFLEKLDELQGRLIDNANFFSVEDPNLIDADQLYKLLISEYPQWLKLAQQKGFLS